MYLGRLGRSISRMNITNHTKSLYTGTRRDFFHIVNPNEYELFFLVSTIQRSLKGGYHNNAQDTTKLAQKS